MPYTIDEIGFNTKKDIKVRCQAILKDTPDNSIVSEKDTEFLYDLLKYHDQWNLKSEGGVKGISTKTTEHGTRCFDLIKENDLKEDISFHHAIKHIPTNRSKPLIPQALLDYKSAARTAIKSQINNFRNSALFQTMNCPYTDEVLDRENCHIDHIPPDTFNKILFEFSVTNKINPLMIGVDSRNGVVAVFADKELEASWQSYHQTNAKLRAISRTGNLQLAKPLVPWEEITA